MATEEEESEVYCSSCFLTIDKDDIKKCISCEEEVCPHCSILTSSNETLCFDCCYQCDICFQFHENLTQDCSKCDNSVCESCTSETDPKVVCKECFLPCYNCGKASIFECFVCAEAVCLACFDNSRGQSEICIHCAPAYYAELDAYVE
jgi:hypothetical protein